MPRPLQITSLTNPRIKQVVRLREHRQRRKAGAFIAEGMREVSRAIDAGLSVLEIHYCPTLLGEANWQQLQPKLPASAQQIEVVDAVFRKMAYLREPEGILAVVEQPRWSLEGLTAKADAFYLVAVGIEKPGNLGAMVRTAEAAGCDAVLAAGAPIDAFNPNAIRTSTCAVFTLPVVAADEAEVIAFLKARNCRILAATLEGAVAHTQADYSNSIAIAIGPEDVGLSADWLAAADATAGQRVLIGMQGKLVDSLNASNAAAILLFEALRQRNLH